MNTQDPKCEQKLKSIPSPEQNYFAGFAMRHPVIYPKNVGTSAAMNFTLDKYLALMSIKILGAVLELPAKENC